MWYMSLPPHSLSAPLSPPSLPPSLPPCSPPVTVGVDAYGNSIPGEVPRLFGGDVLQYIMATGSEIPLIVLSCTKAIEKEGT